MRYKRRPNVLSYKSLAARRPSPLRLLAGVRPFVLGAALLALGLGWGNGILSRLDGERRVGALYSSVHYYPNCDAARSAGVAPIHLGQPGYRSELDADDDGIACEPYGGW